MHMTPKFISRKWSSLVDLRRVSRIERTRQNCYREASFERRWVAEEEIYILKIACRHYYHGDIIAWVNHFFVNQAEASGSLNLKLHGLLKELLCLLKTVTLLIKVNFENIGYY